MRIKIYNNANCNNNNKKSLYCPTYMLDGYCDILATTMALQNLEQYGCQTGKKLKEKSRDLNRNSSRNKNETMFGRGYENCPELEF
jgi:hypothetical protein